MSLTASIVRKLAGDVVGINRVCGLRTSARWSMEVARNWREVLASRDLQAADRALGSGPFRAKLGPATALLTGQGAFSGLREIWARDVYLGNGFLTISPDAVVVDLGANVGNFTVLALGHGPGVRVVSVEANTDMCRRDLPASLAANGWGGRAQILNAFVGGMTTVQNQMHDDARHAGAAHWSEKDLISAANLTNIDFLKCDIEGSEYELLTRQSALLEMTSQLAIELHSWAGKPANFVALLRDLGFETRVSNAGGDDLIVLARRRRPN